MSSVYFEGHRVQPLAGLISVRPKGGLPGPPPVIPLPESLTVHGPYVRLSCPGLARARNVSWHWGPPRACYRVPCCKTLKRETAVAPIYIHTYIHVYIHTYIHTYIHMSIYSLCHAADEPQAKHQHCGSARLGRRRRGVVISY